MAHALATSGFPVVVTDLEKPTAIRRTVAFSTAIGAGSIEVEGLSGVRVDGTAEALEAAGHRLVAVMPSPELPDLRQSVVVDARLAKKNIDTSIDQAQLVVALGPGFEAGVDCDVVVETQRGHSLGRIITEGSAAPNTGIPGDIGGVTNDRVVRAEGGGEVSWEVSIGDLVEDRQHLGSVGEAQLEAPIAGVVRGLIAPGFIAEAGLKIADIDPRADPSACFEISDKSRLVGAGVLMAVLNWLNRDLS